MRQRTVWRVLMTAMVLQLLLGNAWAMRPLQRSGPVAHCHAMNGQVMQEHGHDAASAQAVALVSTHSKYATLSPLTDCHHCCAVGLAVSVLTFTHSLSNAVPHAVHPRWCSVHTPPDLRPPIA